MPQENPRLVPDSALRQRLIALAAEILAVAATPGASVALLVDGRPAGNSASESALTTIFCA